MKKGKGFEKAESNLIQKKSPCLSKDSDLSNNKLTTDFFDTSSFSV
ncbi:hypothetical protein K4E_23640 [Enterococcus thailandicus]|nr:hypothetical protein K4E_23640 [Enterococcus thailandicus]